VAVKAMVWVHQAGSVHWARKLSMDRLSSWPEPSSRGRSSMIVSRQY